MKVLEYMSIKTTNNEHLNNDETVNEVRQGPKFRPVLHALTSNPGVEMMNYAAGKENMITLAQGEGDSPTPD